jgi:L-arabinose isomerase
MESEMKKYLLIIAAMMLATQAHARIFHYTCKGGDDRYALTVNTDQRTVKLIKRSPTIPVATFRILKEASIDKCAKYGWILNGGATFCTATQGVGDLNWPGHDALDCDQADTE